MTIDNSTTYSIYRIYCSQTKQSYVGQTKDTDIRWSQHCGLLKIGKHHSYKLQDAFWKFGLSGFTFEILEHGIQSEDATSREAYWMKEHNGYSTEKSKSTD